MGTMFPCGLLRRSSSRYLLVRPNWREECIRGIYDEFEGLVSGDTKPSNYLSRSSSLLLSRSLLSPGIRLLALLIGLSALLRRLPLLALLGRGTIGLLAPLLCGLALLWLLAPLLRGLALLRLLAPLLCGLPLLRGLTGVAGILPPLVALHTLLLTPLLLSLLGSSAVLLLAPLLATLLTLRGHGTVGLAPLLCGLALLRPLTPLRRRGRLLSRCRGNVRGTPLSGSRSISLLAIAGSLLPIAGSLLRRQRLAPLLRRSGGLLARKRNVALSLALPGLLRGQRLSPLLLLRLLLHGGCAVLRLLTPLLGSLRGLLRGHRRVAGLRLLYVRRWCRSGCLWLDLWRGRRLILRKRRGRRSVLRLSLRLCHGCLRALLRVKLRFLCRCRCRCRTGNGRRIGLSLRFRLRLFSLVVCLCGNSLFDRCSLFGLRSFFCRCSLFCLCGHEGLSLRFLRSRFRLAHLRQCGFCNWCRLIVWHGSRGYSSNRLLGLCGRMTRICLCGDLSRSE